jgi:hypothetical protein
VTSTYHLQIAGPVPRSVAELIRVRFGDMTITSRPGRTEIDGPIADQAAVRSLLNMLWDVGSDIRLLRVCECFPAGPARATEHGGSDERR